jgi:hypothetical protein
MMITAAAAGAAAKAQHPGAGMLVDASHNCQRDTQLKSQLTCVHAPNPQWLNSCCTFDILADQGLPAGCM